MWLLFEYESLKDCLIKYKCLSCNKKYSNRPNEELKKKFKNTFKFSDNDIKTYKNFRKMCLTIYQLDPAKFLSAPGLA